MMAGGGGLGTTLMSPHHAPLPTVSTGDFPPRPCGPQPVLVSRASEVPSREPPGTCNTAHRPHQVRVPQCD